MREETPDSYRNSALRMYGAEMKDMNYDEDEDTKSDAGDDGRTKKRTLENKVEGRTLLELRMTGKIPKRWRKSGSH
ncbi:hypothetical protein PM082_015024 [Marasmius tenuissimus]|nr:hypothetical protein PM082_015024 [Marasmius tenuissimus]